MVEKSLKIDSGILQFAPKGAFYGDMPVYLSLVL